MKKTKTISKKHKDIIFHKLSNQPFKAMKRFSINRTSKDLLFRDTYHSPKNKKIKKNSVQSSILENLLKSVEEKYSPTSKKILNNNYIKMNSTNKINNIKFKNFFSNKLLQKAEEENNENLKFRKLNSCLKLDKNNIQPKKFTSSNNVNFFKNFIYSNLKNNNNGTQNYKNKRKSFIPNELLKTINNSNSNNNVNKEKKKKKEIKEEKKNNDLTPKKEITDNTINGFKNKFFCCL